MVQVLASLGVIVGAVLLVGACIRASFWVADRLFPMNPKDCFENTTNNLITFVTMMMVLLLSFSFLISYGICYV